MSTEITHVCDICGARKRTGTGVAGMDSAKFIIGFEEKSFAHLCPACCEHLEVGIQNVIDYRRNG